MLSVRFKPLTNFAKRVYCRCLLDLVTSLVGNYFSSENMSFPSKIWIFVTEFSMYKAKKMYKNV